MVIAAAVARRLASWFCPGERMPALKLFLVVGAAAARLLQHHRTRLACVIFSFEVSGTWLVTSAFLSSANCLPPIVKTFGDEGTIDSSFDLVEVSQLLVTLLLDRGFGAHVDESGKQQHLSTTPRLAAQDGILSFTIVVRNDAEECSFK